MGPGNPLHEARVLNLAKLMLLSVGLAIATSNPRGEVPDRYGGKAHAHDLRKSGVFRALQRRGTIFSILSSWRLESSSSEYTHGATLLALQNMFRGLHAGMAQGQLCGPQAAIADRAGQRFDARDPGGRLMKFPSSRPDYAG